MLNEHRGQRTGSPGCCCLLLLSAETSCTARLDLSRHNGSLLMCVRLVRPFHNHSYSLAMPDSELSSTGRFRRKDSRRTGEDGHSVQRDHSDSEEKLLSGSNAVVLQSKALETLAFSSTRAHEPPTKPRATRLASPPGESGTDIARSAHSVHDISLMGDERLGSMSTGGAQKVGGGWGGPSREDTGAGTGIMTEVSWGKRVARGWGENSSAVWDRHADNGWGQFQRHAGSDACSFISCHSARHSTDFATCHSFTCRTISIKLIFSVSLVHIS